MDDQTIERIYKLKLEQEFLYNKYYDGKATKKDIKRIDEITCILLEINYEG
jgi:hypothetical protein